MNMRGKIKYIGKLKFKAEGGRWWVESLASATFPLSRCRQMNTKQFISYLNARPLWGNIYKFEHVGAQQGTIIT